MKYITNNTISEYIAKLSTKKYALNELVKKVGIVTSFIDWMAKEDKVSKEDAKRFLEQLSKITRTNPSTKPSFDNVSSKGKFPIRYVGYILLALTVGILGTGIYNRFFLKTKTPLAFSTSPVRAGRTISFQGRLTDSLGNPITAPIDITYNFYTDPTGGSPISGSTRVCTANGDVDGVFSSLIGNDLGPSCSSELPDSIFTENPTVYLGVTVGSEVNELSPRQQIANVGYAINAETLQGMPPGQTTSTVPFINQDGDLLVAVSNPGIRSTFASANFTISSAQATTIQSAGSGDIALSATQGGALRFNTYNGTLGERMTILASGNVGISNINPTMALDVVGSATTSGNLSSGGQVKLGELTAAPTSLGAGSLYYNSSAGKIYYNNGTAWSEIGSGASAIQYWQQALGTLTPANITNALNLGNTATASALVHLPGTNNQDAWFNLGTGNVGIGTMAPGAKLTVAATTPTLRLESTSGGAALTFGRGTGSTYDASIKSGIYNGKDMIFYSGATPMMGMSNSGGFSFGSTYVATDPGLNNMIVQGNVGIGTTAPGQKLNVVGGNENTFTSNITKAAGVDAQINGVGGLDVAFTGDGAAGVSGAYSYYGARINNSFVSSDNTGAATNIGLQVDVSGGDNNYGLIVGTGNVGIGTAAPTYNLQTVGSFRAGLSGTNRFTSVSSSGVLTARYDDNSIKTTLNLENRDTGAGDEGISQLFNLERVGGTTGIGAGKFVVQKEQAWTSTASTQDSYLALSTALDGTLSEKLRINSGGNVGIGNTSPTAKLDVTGNLNVSTYATVSASLALGTSTAAAGAGNLDMSGNLTLSGEFKPGGSAGTSGQYLISGGSFASPSWTSTIGATSVPFSGITSGTNTTAAMVVGAGASLNYTSTGTINASSLLGGTWAAPGAIGTTTPAAGNFTTIGATTQGTGAFTTLTASNTGAGALDVAGGIYAGTSNAFQVDTSGNISSSGTTGLTLSGAGADLIFSGTGPNQIQTASGVSLALMPGGTGNVGVGTTSPAYKLDVNGSFRVQNNGMAIDSSGYSTTPTTNTPWNAFTYSNPQNIIPNGDLESWTAGTSTYPDGFTNWSTAPLITRENTATNVHQGNYSSKIVANATGAYFIGLMHNATRIDKNPNDTSTGTYTISFWYKQPSTNTQTANIGVFDTAASSYVLSENLLKDDAWHFFSKTFSIRYDSNWYIRWSVASGTATTGDTLYTDAISLTKGSETYQSVQSPLATTGNVTRWGDFYNMGGNVGIGNTSPGAKLDIGLAGTTLGTLRLEGNTSGYTQIQPSAAAGSWTFTLPTSGGTSGYILTTNGSGTTSWSASVPASSVSFSGITSGTNTTAAMVVGTGSSLTYSSGTAFTGGINADYLEGLRGITTVEALRSNANITGGGTITVDASYNIKWTARFITIANGRNSAFGTNGYFDITQPAATTAITGVGGAANRTWTASGVLLNGWEALYYILPIGSTSTSVPANFRIVSYTSDLDVPADWVLLAVRNGDGGSATVRFANGISLLANQSYNTSAYSTAYAPNSAQLLGATWVAPGAIGSTTANTGKFTTLWGTTSLGVGYDPSTLSGGVAAFNGNVGIGTVAPVAKLDVAGNTSNNIQTILTRGADSNFQLIASNGSGNAIGDKQAYFGLRYSGSNDANTGINFYRGSSSTNAYMGFLTNATEQLRIDGSGNVGIGNTSPTAKLDVTGNLNVSTYATVSASLALGTSTAAPGAGNLNMSGNLTLSGEFKPGGSAGTSGQYLISSGPGATPTWTSTVGASSVSFSGITSGTNTTAAMVVGAGGSLNYTSTGTINASSLIGGTWAAPGAIGTTTPAAGNFTTIGATTLGTGAFTTLSANSTGNALTLSGAGANIAFSGAGVGQITTASGQHLALMPGGTGNVGIGTITPGAKLSLSGGDLLIDSNNTNSGLLYLKNSTNYGSSRNNYSISAMGSLAGRLINRNAEFLDGITGYNIYDNASSGKTTRAAVADTQAPNSSGTIMRVSYDGTGTPGTSPQPGYGGFYIGIGRCTGTNSGVNGFCYQEGNRYLIRIWAKIPIGRNIQWASNLTGTGSTHKWLTSTAGTGDWMEYDAIQTIGLGGTLSSTGFWYITTDANNIAFNWDVASLQMTDLDESPSIETASNLNIGYYQGKNLTFGEIINTQGAYLAASGGNVGIANISPGAKLDIGTAGSTLGTLRLEGNTSGYTQIQPSAAAGSWTLTLPTSGGTNGYILTTNGSGTTSWSASVPGSSVSFSGITSGTNTTAAMVVGAGASLNYTSTGTINASSLLGGTWAAPGAIGTTTPAAGNFTTIGATTLGTGAFTTLSANSTGNALTLSGAGANIAFSGAGLAQITTATSQHLALMPGGNVGIGTTGPSAKLEINGVYNGTYGSELISNTSFASGTVGWTLSDSATYDSVNQNVDVNYVTGNTGADISTTFAAVSGKKYMLSFDLSNVSGDNVAISFTNITYSSPLFFNGTQTMAFVSDFTGTETISFTNAFSNNGSTWTIDNVSIKEISTPQSTLKVIGYDNKTYLSLGGDIQNNLAMGRSALGLNTTGINNFAFGNDSLLSNTTGSSNYASGNLTLVNNTTGSDNFAIGTYAMVSNIDGYSNTAIGNMALGFNTSGSDNIALGNMAGLFDSTYSPNQISTDSIYFGNMALPLTSGDTNEIVIGSNVIGAGSNSVVLGNDGIVTTLLKGNVGIGNTSPAAKLDVTGNLNVSTYATVSASLALGTSTAAPGAGNLDMSGNLTFAGALKPGGNAGTVGQYLISSGGPDAAPTWTSTIGAASVPFSGITSGTNTTAAMVVGAGASLNYTSTGTINASSLIGGTWAAPGTIGSTTANTGKFTTLEATSTGNALTLSGAGANIAFSGAGVGQITTASGQHLALMPGGTGNVGIGTTSPGTLLNVNGTFRVGTTANEGLDFNPGSGAMYVGGISQNGSISLKNASSTTNISLNSDIASYNSYFLGGLMIGTATTTGVSGTGYNTSHLVTKTLPSNLWNNAVFDSISTADNAGVNNVLINAAKTSAISSGLSYSALKITESNTGADTAGTIDLYGVNSNMSATSSVNAATHSTYAGYFSSVGNANGTSTTYGLYTTASGADTNYGLYSAAGLNYFSGNVGIGVAAPTTAKLQVAGDIIADQLIDTTGSGAYYINPAGNSSLGGNVTIASTYGVDSTAAGTLYLGNTNATTIAIGTSATARTLTLGNITGATALALNSGTGDIILTSTDQIKLNSSKAAGGTTTEAFSFKSTVDLAAADEVLQIGDSALDMMTIRGDGNVGIGTAVPSSKLSVNGELSFSSIKPLQYNTGNNTYYYKLGNLNGLGSRITLEITGQNGYGNPQTNITYATVSVGNADNEFGAWQYTIGDYGSTGKPIVFYKDNGGTNNSDVYVQLGTFFIGSVKITNSYGFTLDGAPQTAVADPTATAATDGYFVNSNVGIGNTNPGMKLDVTGSIRANADQIFNVDSDTHQIIASGLTDQNKRVYMGYDTTGDYGYIQSHLRGTSSKPLVLQPSAGNVGIGITTPGAKLHILGTGTGTALATSGTTDATINERICRGTVCLDVGTIDNGTSYIQNHLAADFSSNLQMALNPNGGNVGIGTIAPGYTLDLVGNQRIQSTFDSENGGATATYDLYNYGVVSGGTTLTGNRSYYGAVNRLDTNSSSTNGTYTKTAFGASNSVYNGISGNDSPMNTIYGTYSLADNRSYKPVGTLYGAYNYSINRSNDPIGGDVSSMYGSYNYVYNYGDATDASDVTSLYGVYSNVTHANTTTGTATTGTLFRGAFTDAGDKIATKYGVYVAGEDSNYFSNTVVAAQFTDTTGSGAYYMNPAGTSVLGGNIEMRSATPTILGYDSSTTTYYTLHLKGQNNTTTASVSIDGSGSGDGKLDVGTVDPPYTIDGKKYATYLTSMTGVKEETTGVAHLTQKNDQLQAYTYTINFNTQDEASDLWLFSKTTNLKQNIKDMTVLLSSSSNGKTWYTVDKENQLLTFFSSTPADISYRLTAPRFDSSSWANRRDEDDSNVGFVINSEGTLDLGNASQVAYNAPTLTKSINNVFSLIGDFVDEFMSVNKALIANLKTGVIETEDIIINNALSARETITSSLTASVAHIETLIVSNKIKTPIVETVDIKASGSSELSSISTNNIKPLKKDVTIDLSKNSSPSGSLARLVINGLNNAPVATFDSAGNATLSGTLVADQVIASSSAFGSSAIAELSTNNASVSGTLIAKEIQADNINSSMQQFSSTINDVQQQLTALKTAPLADVQYYQKLDDSVVGNITITDTANIYKASISDSLMVGSLLFEQNSLLALSSDLKISSLSTIHLFDDAVIIAKNGTMSVKGEISASSLAIKNTTGETVASIDASGSARFNEVVAQKFTLSKIATNGALIADSGIKNEQNEAIPAIKTDMEVAGTGVIPQDTKEVIIYNDNVTSNSLIYLTPTADNVGSQLAVTNKSSCPTGTANGACTPYFVISSSSTIHTEIPFNWLIIN